MLGLLRRVLNRSEPQPTPPAKPSVTPVVLERMQVKHTLSAAEWHAFRSQQLDAAGDEQEAQLHLGDAAEYLQLLGGPKRVGSAEEIYQWCAAKRAGEV